MGSTLVSSPIIVQQQQQTADDLLFNSISSALNQRNKVSDWIVLRENIFSSAFSCSKKRKKSVSCLFVYSFILTGLKCRFVGRFSQSMFQWVIVRISYWFSLENCKTYCNWCSIFLWMNGHVVNIIWRREGLGLGCWFMWE